jgi:hypothetical protein
LALKAAESSCFQPPTRVSIQNLSKYSGEVSAEAFLHTFNSEAGLVGILDNSAKLRVFPSLICGEKSTFA